MSRPIPICRPVSLPEHLAIHAAEHAVVHYAQNRPSTDPADMMSMGGVVPAQRLAGSTGKVWKPGTKIMVGFLERTSTAMRDRILAHANAWSKTANISFVYTTQSPVIRITFQGDGYWSYLGTDCLSIPRDEPTLCLQDFTLRTPEREWRRVVRHEIGHALSFIHEHARLEIVERLHVARTIAYFRRSQGWDEAMVRDQILTPLEVRALWLPGPASVHCIMCYQFEGECTKDHQPIPGGLDITDDDYAVAAKIYHGLDAPEEPPAPEPPAPPTPGIVPLPVGGQAEAAVSPLAPAKFGFAVSAPQSFRLAIRIPEGDTWLGDIPANVAAVGPSGKSTPLVLPDGRVARFRVVGPGAYELHVSYPLARRIVAHLTVSRSSASSSLMMTEVPP